MWSLNNAPRRPIMCDVIVHACQVCRTYLKVLLSGTLATIFLASLGCSKESDKGKPPPIDPNPVGVVGKSPATETTAEQLAKEFTGEPEQAAKKYAFQPLILKGVVLERERIQKELFGEHVVVLGDSKGAKLPIRVEMKCVYLVRDGVLDKRLGALRPGQKIEVKCPQGVSFFGKTISSNGVRLVSGWREQKSKIGD